MTTAQRRLVVVGNGMVGQRLVDEVLDRDADWQLTVIGEEPTAAYDRVALSSWFDGAGTDDLIITPAVDTIARGVDLRLGTAVTAINRPASTVTLDDGSDLVYDHLVLATGSLPFIPPIEQQARTRAEDTSVIAGRR